MKMWKKVRKSRPILLVWTLGTLVSIMSGGCVQRRHGANPNTGSAVRAVASGPASSLLVPFTLIYGESGAASEEYKNSNPTGFLFAKDGSKRQFFIGTDGADHAYWPDPSSSSFPSNFRDAIAMYSHLLFVESVPAGYRPAMRKEKCNTYSQFLSSEDVLPESDVECSAFVGSLGTLNPNDPKSEYGEYLLLAKEESLNSKAPSPSASAPAEKDITKILPPEKPAQGLDKDLVVNAIADAATTISPDDDRQRPGCLANARTLGWTDIAVHYYCALDYKKFRVCYSSELARLRGPKPQPAGFVAFSPDWGVQPPLQDAATFKKTLNGLRGLHAGAWQACFDSGEAGDWFAAKAGRKAIFQALVWTLPGVADYQVDQEQASINAHYESSAKIPRFLRPFDAKPKWSADVARYSKIEQVQAANLSILSK